MRLYTRAIVLISLFLPLIYATPAVAHELILPIGPGLSAKEGTLRLDGDDHNFRQTSLRYNLTGYHPDSSDGFSGALSLDGMRLTNDQTLEDHELLGLGLSMKFARVVGVNNVGLGAFAGVNTGALIGNDEILISADLSVGLAAQIWMESISMFVEYEQTLDGVVGTLGDGTGNGTRVAIGVTISI